MNPWVISHPDKDVKFNGYISEFDTGFFTGLFRSTGCLPLVSMENPCKHPGELWLNIVT